MTSRKTASELSKFIYSSILYGHYLPHFISLCCITVLIGLTPYLNLYVSSLFYTHLQGNSYTFFLAVSITLVIQQTLSSLLHGLLQISASILGAYQSALVRTASTSMMHARIKSVGEVDKLDQKIVADLDSIFSYTNQLIFSVISSVCGLVGNFIFLAQFNLLRLSFGFFSIVLANNALVYFLSSSHHPYSLASLIRTSNNQASTLRNHIRAIEKNRATFSGQPSKLTWFLTGFRSENQYYTRLSYLKTLYRGLIETTQQILTRLVHPLVAYSIIRLYRITFPLSNTGIAAFHIVGLGSILQIFKTFTSLWKEGSFCKRNLDSLSKSSSAYANFTPAFSALQGKTSAFSSFQNTQRLPSVSLLTLRSLVIFLLLHKSLAVLFSLLEGLPVFFSADIFFPISLWQLGAIASLTMILFSLHPVNANKQANQSPLTFGLFRHTSLLSRLDLDLASNLCGLVVFSLATLGFTLDSIYLSRFLSLLSVLVSATAMAWIEKHLHRHSTSQLAPPTSKPVLSPNLIVSKKSAISPSQFLLLPSTNLEAMDRLATLADDHDDATPKNCDHFCVKILCRQGDLSFHITGTPSLPLQKRGERKPFITTSPLQSLLYAYLLTSPLDLTERDTKLLVQWPVAKKAILDYLNDTLPCNQDKKINFDILATGQIALLEKEIVPSHLSGGQKVKLSCAILYGLVKLINHMPNSSIFIGLDEGSGLEGFNTHDQKAVFTPILHEIEKGKYNRFVIATSASTTHCLARSPSSPQQIPLGCNS